MKENKSIRILFVAAVNPFSEVQNRYPPLWPAYLAANLDKHLDVRLQYRFATHKIEKEISAFKPDLVAISSVTQNYNRAVEYARIAKEYDLPVVIGGMHITSMPGCLTSDMDVGCIGEGEETFLDLVKHYLEEGNFRGDKMSRINGIIYHEGGQLVITPDRAQHKEMDLIPHPKRSIIGYGKRAYIYSARGCSYKCVFCSCTRYWGEVRYASPEFVLEEVEELVRNGVRIIRFADENFVRNRNRLKIITDMIISKGINRLVKFSCWCRANNVTAETVEMLKAMNVVSVKMGLESGCDRTLRYLKGNVTVSQNRQAIRLFKKAGIQVNGDFIIGAPDETKEEVMQTYEFIKNSPLDFVDVNILSPLPGTPVWEYCVQKKIVSNDMDWSRINFKFNGSQQKPVIVSEHLSLEELKALYKKFNRLRNLKMLSAIRRTPWLGEFPKVVLRQMIEYVMNKAFYLSKS